MSGRFNVIFLFFTVMFFTIYDLLYISALYVYRFYCFNVFYSIFKLLLSLMAQVVLVCRKTANKQKQTKNLAAYRPIQPLAYISRAGLRSVSRNRVIR